jgi:hypothetical protein
MSALTRRTYDTDSIVLRRIFAVNPLTNQQFSTGSILATSTTGAAFFIDGNTYFASLGLPTSSSFPSTVAGLGTAGYISTAGGGSGDVTTANLVSTVVGLGQAGYISTGGGSGDVTQANLTSTTQGLGTLSYLSSPQLISTVRGLDKVAVTKIVAGSDMQVSPADGKGEVTVSYVGGGGGGITSGALASTVTGLGTMEYISSPTLVSSIAGGLASTLTGLSNLNVTKLVAGTGISLSPADGLGEVTITNTGGGGGGLTTDQLASTITGLGTSDYISTLTLMSTVGNGIASTLTGLSNVNVTKLVAGTGISLSPADGLGEVTITNTGGAGGLTTDQLTSTITGLGTID